MDRQYKVVDIDIGIGTYTLPVLVMPKVIYLPFSCKSYLGTIVLLAQLLLLL